MKDFTNAVPPKPVQKRRSRWRIILFFVCTALVFTVLICGYAVTMVASAILKGVGEAVVAVTTVMWALFIPLLIAMIWLLSTIEPIPLFVRVSQWMGWS